jgi:hypothetical protein
MRTGCRQPCKTIVGTGEAMRYVAMQVLTWGTIAGAIGSALLLAALEGPQVRYAIEPPDLSALPIEPTRAGRSRAPTTPASAPGAASASRADPR